MGIGDWGLGIGDWEKGNGINHQFHKINPHSTIPKKKCLKIFKGWDLGMGDWG